MSQADEESHGLDRLKQIDFMRVGLAAAVWILLCLVLLGYNHYPGRFSLDIGDQSPRDVQAFRTVKYFDPDETTRLKEEAAQREEPIYSRMPAAMAEAEDDLLNKFDLLDKATVDPEALEALLEQLKQQFPGAQEASLTWFAQQNEESRRELRQSALELLRDQMSREIRDNPKSLEDAQSAAQAAIKEKITSRRTAELISAAVTSAMRANRYLDTEATEERRKTAMAEVKGVERLLQAGDYVIMKGERVTGHHLAMFRALGLSSPWSAGGWPKAATLCLLVLLGVLFLGVFARQFDRAIYDDNRQLLLFGLVVCISTFAYNLFLLPLPNLSMFFFPASTLIIAVLLSRQTALAAAVVQSLLAGLAAGGSLNIALPTLGACLAAMLAADHIWPPSQLLRASVQLALANFALSFSAGALSDVPWSEVFKESGVALGYGACAPLLALGSIFLLQRPFGITSHVRLMELANPREPLLQKLQAEAPGTYYSSIIVANLAEAAAQAIGADALLARVGAIYHDIGKLRRPGLFVENQFLLGTEDAHTRLSPYLSALVILSHVRDGLEMGRRHGLPRELLNIIEEHHGTSLVSYFYNMAREQNGEPPSDKHYRYEGRLPHSKESAIIMLADVTQAAAKSLDDPTPEQMESLVENIVAERVKDGQLIESDITFRDLTRIKEVFVRNLQGLHLHTRVQYPAFMRVLEKSATANSKSSEEAPKQSRPQADRSSRHAR